MLFDSCVGLHLADLVANGTFVDSADEAICHTTDGLIKVLVLPHDAGGSARGNRRICVMGKGIGVNGCVSISSVNIQGGGGAVVHVDQRV
jgi:hypothetical protein